MTRIETMDVAGSDDEIKKIIIQALIERGWPRENAAEAFDLATFAADEAVRVMFDVTGRCGAELAKLQATALAIDFIVSKLEFLKKQTLEFIKEMNV